MLSRSLTQSTCVVAMTTAVVTSAPLYAADPDDGPEPAEASVQSPPQVDPDFLFGRPRGFSGISGGWLAASQSGPIFDDVRDFFTVDKRAFDSALIRLGLGLTLAPRVDLLFEVEVSQATVRSEERHFTEENGLPILQTTQFKQVPLSGSLRFWLRPRGREVGSYAWVPNDIAPYVGIGGGTLRYRFTQFGDFTWEDLSRPGEYYIDYDTVNSQGWAAKGHAFVGTSIKLSRRLFATVEARYVWASTHVQIDSLGYLGNIDLSGLRMTGGIEFIF